MNDINNYKRLLGFLKPHLKLLLLAFGVMIGYSVLNGASPMAVIPFVDNIVSGSKIVLNENPNIPQFVIALVDMINTMPQVQLFKSILLFFFVAYALRNIFSFFQNFLMFKLGEGVIRDIKDRLYKKMLALSMSFYSKNPTAELMSRITYDTNIIRESMTTGLLDLMLRPMEILGLGIFMAGVVMYTKIPVNFLLTSALLFPCILLPAILLGKQLRKLSKRSQEKMGGINTILFEIMTGIRIVKSFSMQDYEYNKFKDQNQGFYKLQVKTAKKDQIISPLNEITASLYLVLILLFSAKDIFNGTLSFGSVSAFMFAMLLMLKPIKRLSKVYMIIQKGLASATRIFDILDTDIDIKEKSQAFVLPQINEKITFENIDFKYKDEQILKGLDLEVKKGEIVAIVGPSGAGKTTLINLLPRFYDPVSGKISIDGIDLKDVTLKSLRDQIGLVTQEMVLFNDTVYNNITYGVSGHTKEEVIKAAKIANAHEFIENMPQGYDTMIGEKGLMLSGGQRQRLSIARAIFKNPPILIFDEATSHLDTESEKLVQEAIDRLMQGRTVFVIAHRLSTIKNSTNIIVLEGGSIVEQGSHDELIAQQGLYKKLHDIQFEK